MFSTIRIVSLISLFLLLCSVAFAMEPSQPGKPQPKEARECKSLDKKPNQPDQKKGSNDPCSDNGKFKYEEPKKDQCEDKSKPCCCDQKKDEGKGDGGGVPPLAFPPIPQCKEDEDLKGLACKKKCEPPMEYYKPKKVCQPIHCPETRNEETRQCETYYQTTPRVQPFPVSPPAPPAPPSPPPSP